MDSGIVELYCKEPVSEFKVHTYDSSEKRSIHSEIPFLGVLLAAVPVRARALCDLEDLSRRCHFVAAAQVLALKVVVYGQQFSANIGAGGASSR